MLILTDCWCPVVLALKDCHSCRGIARVCHSCRGIGRVCNSCRGIDRAQMQGEAQQQSSGSWTATALVWHHHNRDCFTLYCISMLNTASQCEVHTTLLPSTAPDLNASNCTRLQSTSLQQANSNVLLCTTIHYISLHQIKMHFTAPNCNEEPYTVLYCLHVNG